MNVGSFKRQMGRRPTRVSPFHTPVVTCKAGDVASMPWYWHPDRAGVELAPESFRTRLADISPLLALCRPPGNAPLVQKWAMCMRKPSIQSPVCPGWLLLFLWEDAQGTVLPLDNRVLANLYMISKARFGSGRKYFEHCVGEMQRDKAAREKTYQSDRAAQQKEFRQSTHISNLGKGNKFARHHDGTLIPSQGQLNWHAQERRKWIPSAVRQDEDRQREKLREIRDRYR